MLQDVRYAFRMLVVQPAWTLAAIACLAIATGANTAAFSVVNAVLLRPLPFPESDRLVMVALKVRERSDTRPFALREYRDLAAHTLDVTELAAYTFFPVSLSGEGGARMVEAQMVSDNYFGVLRVAPLAGQFFDQSADRPGGMAQAVISERLWRQRFGRDPATVGRVLRVNGRPTIVSGIAPAGFVGAMGLIAPDMWLPAALYPSLASQPDVASVPMFGVVGRRVAGVTNAQAQEQLGHRLDRLARDRGDATAPAVVVDPASGFGVPPSVRRRLPAAVAMVFLLAAMVIAVAAANVASLVLARGTRRVREMGVRLALGASPSRVARQLLTESLVLALLGSAVGMLVSFWVTHLMQPGVSNFEYVTFAVDISPDLRVFAYAVAGAFVTAAVFGLIPAFLAARTDLITVLKPSAGAGPAPATTRSLRALVIGQIAVSTILLMASGLLARSYLNARAIDPGFDTHHLLSASLDLTQLGITSEDAGRRLYAALLESVSALPGVEGLGLTREAPLSASGQEVSIWVEETGRGPSVSGPHTSGSLIVTAPYFGVVGVPLVQGRLFTSRDASGPPVAVINETMARRFWPAASPLGRSFRVAAPLGDQLEVVGVVRDVKYRSLTEAPSPAFYRPFSQQYSARMTLLVRSHAAPDVLAAAVRQQIASLNSDLPVMQMRSLDEQLTRANAPRRQIASFLTILGAIGLLLATIGLYGVVSFGVRSRAREFGIRIALGATSRDVRRMVMASGLGTVAIGLTAGVGASALVARLFAGLLFGVATYDPLTIGVVCSSLTAVALIALYLPARWATAVEPAITLRNES